MIYHLHPPAIRTPRLRLLKVPLPGDGSTTHCQMPNRRRRKILENFQRRAEVTKNDDKNLGGMEVGGSKSIKDPYLYNNQSLKNQSRHKTPEVPKTKIRPFGGKWWSKFPPSFCTTHEICVFLVFTSKVDVKISHGERLGGQEKMMTLLMLQNFRCFHPPQMVPKPLSVVKSWDRLPVPQLVNLPDF